MKEGKLHYGWIVIFMGLLTTIAAHGFGRMAYTIILPAMKDGLQFNYTQLGLLGTGNFIGYLTMAIIEAFERAGNPSYQAAHAISLGLLNAHSAGQLLYQELLNRPDPNLKAQLAVSLGMMRYTDALDTIRQLVIDPRDPGARLQYATALGLMGDAEVLPLLLAELRQAKTLGALSATAKVIGILGDKAAIPTLKEMIEDDSSSGLARGFACSALGRIAEKSESSWKTRISEGGNYRIVLPSLIEILDTP